MCTAFVNWILDTMEEATLVTLHTGQKWNQTKQNFEVGDIVLVCKNVIQNKWPMTRIGKTYSNEEGLVQSVQLVTLKKKTSIFDQPVNKLVLIVENEF